MEGLTPKQADALKQIRSSVHDLIGDDPKYNDRYLLKWLVARRYDVKKSEEMLRKHFDWRVEWDVDNILEWTPPEVLLEYMPGGFYGEDRDGHPVWYQFSGNFDMDGITRSVKKKDVMRYCIWLMETLGQRCKEQSKKYSKHIDSMTFVNDLTGYKLSIIMSPGAQNFFEAMQMMQDNYPEFVKVSVVLHPPRIFPIVYSIVKPFMNEDMRRKMRIAGNDWKEQLDELIDPDLRPKHFGGNCTDADGNPRCLEHLKFGGKIPESYYLAAMDIVWKTCSIPAGFAKSVGVDVNEAGSTVTYFFKTDNYDIKFNVWRDSFPTDDKKKKSSRGKKATILETVRVNCHLVPEDGSFKAEEPGIYVFKWDNSYSWYHTKIVSYNIVVTPPLVEECEADKVVENFSEFVES